MNGDEIRIDDDLTAHLERYPPEHESAVIELLAECNARLRNFPREMIQRVTFHDSPYGNAPIHYDLEDYQPGVCLIYSLELTSVRVPLEEIQHHVRRID